jgi:hypothetical protein
MNIDDFIRQVEEDEQADRVAEQTKASPIDYARSRGIRPQKVYAALRSGRLVWDSCECGRRVIVIAEADELFKIRDFSIDTGPEDDTDSTGADDE